MLIVGGLAVWRVWGLRTNVADLGFFVHSLGAVWREGLFAETPLTGTSFLRDHWSPLLLPLAPLAATRWGGYWLVGLQAISGGVAVWFARKLTDPWLALCFALAPAVLSAYFFDIHGNVVAIPFLLMCVYGFRSNPTLAVVGGWLAAMGREDVAGIVLLLGLIHWRTVEGKLVALGAGVNLGLWLITREQGAGFLWAYEPSRVLEVVWADGLLLLAVIALTVPWTFFRLDWRYVLLSGAAALPWFLADSLLASTPGFHYWILPVALMLCAVRPERKPIHTGSIAALGLAFGPLGFGFLSFGPPTIPDQVRAVREQMPFILEAHRTIAVVSDESAAVLTELTPLMGHLAEVYALPNPFETLYGIHGDRAMVSRPPLDVTPEVTIGRPPDERYEQVGPLLWRLDS